jgi:hypothetical protein
MSPMTTSTRFALDPFAARSVCELCVHDDEGDSIQDLRHPIAA